MSGTETKYHAYMEVYIYIYILVMLVQGARNWEMEEEFS